MEVITELRHKYGLKNLFDITVFFRNTYHYNYSNNEKIKGKLKGLNPVQYLQSF